MPLAQQLQELESVAVVAAQPDVENHQMGPPLLDHFERRDGVGRRTAAIALVLEEIGGDATNIGLVVDDEHFGLQRYALHGVPIMSQ